MLQEKHKKRLFLSGEIETSATAQDTMGGEIDLDVVIPQHGAPARGAVASTGHHANSRQQFIERKRLAQIIVRAAVQPLYAVGHGVARGQEQDGRRLIGSSKSA